MPTASPVLVSRSPAEALMARAMPKSDPTGSPSARRMFSGLMSRCTMPRRCAAPKALATARAIRTASATGSSPSRASRSRSDSPAT